MKFICKLCNQESKADTFGEIKRMKKICITCRQDRAKQKNVEYRRKRANK